MSIEVKQFDGSSVTPKDDALVYDLIFNSYGVFNGCGISFLGVNQLRVASGRMIVKGRQVVITEETVAAQLSASGAKKGRLYIHIDLSNQTTPAQFMTQVEDVLPNLVQEDDVNYNDGIFEIELCTYDVSETAISNIVETCPIITGGVDLLKSMEEVLANTKPGKAVDALVVKELTDSLKNVGKWTKVATYTGVFTHDIDLSMYSEVAVVSTKNIITVPVAILTEAPVQYGNGFYKAQTDYCGMTVAFSLSQISTDEHSMYINGQNQSTSSQFTILVK